MGEGRVLNRDGGVWGVWWGAVAMAMAYAVQGVARGRNGFRGIGVRHVMLKAPRVLSMAYAIFGARYTYGVHCTEHFLGQ
eukprot:scaffold6270_cov98-Isochrysis_galbana.AAC.3